MREATRLDTLFDHVECIRKAYWESYTSRREYEWKISLGIWGALLATLAVLLKGEVPLLRQPGGMASHLVYYRFEYLQIIMLLLTGFLCVLHGHFMAFIRRGHFIDQTWYEALRDWQKAHAFPEPPPEWLTTDSDVPKAKVLTTGIGGGRAEWVSKEAAKWGKHLLAKELAASAAGSRDHPGRSGAECSEAVDEPKGEMVRLRWVQSHHFELLVTILLALFLNGILVFLKP